MRLCVQVIGTRQRQGKDRGGSKGRGIEEDVAGDPSKPTAAVWDFTERKMVGRLCEKLMHENREGRRQKAAHPDRQRG
jgi:hypothetical protein